MSVQLRGCCEREHPAVEFNIEGDPRAELIDLIREVRPDQCTLVPVVHGEITSQAGWQPGPATALLPCLIRELQASGVRVSVFVNAQPEPTRWAAFAGADRVELYTEPFARAFETSKDGAPRSFRPFRGNCSVGTFLWPRRQRGA